uniref:GmrSD restriction endonucleases N-terminal domain-containing protein n=1 Tax=uncultured organism TaxID=155900 RepID=D8VMP6_9ZZZZ|nr:protein of unknown function [uncultured organism]
MEIKQLSIQQVLDNVTKGEIRIPAFQRGFVWEPDRVAYLMDSIYKQYPFGTLLLWRTNAVLKHDRKLGPVELPLPPENYPVEYVLDGQQRLTSVFCVFKSGLPVHPDFTWKDIYFDLLAKPDVREQQFVALDPIEVDAARHFPLRAIFDSPEYRKLTKNFDDVTANVVDQVSRAFQQVQIPCNVYQTDDKGIVSIIFERINRQGVPLDTLQLLSAWTWSEEFQLQAEFADLTEELTDFGFGDDDDEENLILRCCAAVLNKEAAPESLLTLSGKVVREGFSRMQYGIKGAIDFLQSNFNVHRLSALPFQTIVVPLSVYFAHEKDAEIKLTAAHRQILCNWFWRTCLSRRYSSGVLRNLKTDIEEIEKLRLNQPSKLGEFMVTVDSTFFTENKFLMGSVNTKTFVLALAQLRPKSFISGQDLDLKDKLRLSNRTEFHHVYPKAFLDASKQGIGKENILANLAFLSRADNRQIGGEAPSQYLAKLPKDVNPVFESALIDFDAFKTDVFEKFIEKRTARLVSFTKDLAGLP